MSICYYDFDPMQSMIGLGKNRSAGNIVLHGRSNNPEMKIMLLSSDSGNPITLKEVFDELREMAFSSDGQLITDEWMSLDSDKRIRFFFLSRQSTRIEVRGELCRYTAFSYVLRNNQIEIYDCDNNSVNHRAYVDITMPIFYSVTKEQVLRKRFLKKAELVDSGYYKVSIECDNIDLYETGYVEYMCGDVPVPLTKEAINNGFFVKITKNEPELITRHRELIDLRRRG